MVMSDRVPVPLPAAKKGKKSKKRGAKGRRGKDVSQRSLLARAGQASTAAVLGTGLAIGAAIGAVLGRRR